jgi:hypothetical protein
MDVGCRRSACRRSAGGSGEETGPSATHSGTVGLTLSPLPEAETSTRLWASTCSESGLVHYRRAACTKANFQAHTKNWKSKNDHQPSQG